MRDGSYAPPHTMDNNDLAKIVDTSDEWIRERTGIGKRHLIEERNDFLYGGAGCAESDRAERN